MPDQFVCRKRGCRADDSTRCAFKVSDKTGTVIHSKQEEARAAGCRVMHYTDLPPHPVGTKVRWTGDSGDGGEYLVYDHHGLTWPRGAWVDVVVLHPLTEGELVWTYWNEVEAIG